jgi:hypothetical protein
VEETVHDRGVDNLDTQQDVHGEEDDMHVEEMVHDRGVDNLDTQQDVHGEEDDVLVEEMVHENSDGDVVFVEDNILESSRDMITTLQNRAQTLATSVKHQPIRQMADRKYIKAAKSMADRYNRKRKLELFEVGDKVALKIPRIDRASSDMPRLPCIVVKVSGHAQGLYRLRSEHGILKNCFPSNELERYTGPLNCAVEGWEKDKWLSLREAAKHQAPWNRFTDNVCKCKGGCSNKKCRCFQKGISCSSHCHSGTNCCNKKYDDNIQLEHSVEVSSFTACTHNFFLM